jgi:Cu(I)/Ag(I) efflux system membrane fusion protein
VSRKRWAGLTLAAILAAGAGGYWAGHRDLALPGLAWLHKIPWFEVALASVTADPVQTGPVLYYQDPDEKPFYSLRPKKTADGRDYRAVHAGEDVSLAEKAASNPAPAALADDRSKRVLYYRNPMGLPDTSPVPKKDSMGMDYIPVYAGEDADGSSVKVSAGKLQRTGVRTEAAAERIINDPVRVPGTVQLDERKVTVVATRTESFINAVAAVTTGDRVLKGAALLQLYSPEVSEAAVQLLHVQDSGIAGAAFGARQRLENLGVPEDGIVEIERTRKVPLSLTWRAPHDGIVLERNATEGMKAAPGDVLFRLADVSTVWVIADVPEYQLGAIKLGAPATIRLRSRPGDVFTGRVSQIYPEVTPETRTAKVRIEIPNPDGVLLPNMYADVDLASGSGSLVVTVPDNAVIDSGTQQIVILDRGDGRFEPRDVEIGQRGGGFTEIRAGLAAGDKVVVAANFLIDAESNLKAALSTMTTSEAKP